MGNWNIVGLETLLISLESGSRPKGGVRGISSGIPSIGAEHLNSRGGFNFENIKYVPNDFASKLKRGIIKTNDILIVKDGATTGKVSLVTDDFPFVFSCVNEHVFICRLKDENLNKRYIFYFLRSEVGQKQIMETFHGAAQGGINSEFVKSVIIPLPSLSEQTNIVVKLDSILPRIQAAKARLEKIPQLLKRFRQSVLADACSGKLTEGWREEKRKTHYFPLEKGLAELRDINVEVPESWVIYGFCDICDISTNLVDAKNFLKYPHIAPDNIEKETGKLLSYRTIEEDKVFSPKHLFFRNQIIYSKIRPYLSKLVIAEFEGLCSADMYPLTSKINIRYLFYYLLSNAFLEFASTAGTRSVLPKINQQELSKIPVPVPSIEEQEEIVLKVEKLLSIASSIEEKYKSAICMIEKLEQAVLAKAFRGELV